MVVLQGATDAVAFVEASSSAHLVVCRLVSGIACFPIGLYQTRHDSKLNDQIRHYSYNEKFWFWFRS